MEFFGRCEGIVVMNLDFGLVFYEGCCLVDFFLIVIDRLQLDGGVYLGGGVREVQWGRLGILGIILYQFQCVYYGCKFVI